MVMDDEVLCTEKYIFRFLARPFILPPGQLSPSVERRPPPWNLGRTIPGFYYHEYCYYFLYNL
jgi:hypothetical protein